MANSRMAVIFLALVQGLGFSQQKPEEPLPSERMSGGKRPVPKPSRGSKTPARPIPLVDSPIDPCGQECKCRRMTRSIQDDLEDSCRRTYIPRGKDDTVRWRVLSLCLHSIKSHCDLLADDDHYRLNDGHDPPVCGPRCRRHSCRCESDAKSCEIGIGEGSPIEERR